MSVSMYKNPPAPRFIRVPVRNLPLLPMELRRTPTGPPLVFRRPSWWPVAPHAARKEA